MVFPEEAAPARVEPQAPAPGVRRKPGERGVAVVGVVGHVAAFTAGVAVGLRLDAAVRLEVSGHRVPASGVALGATLAGALLAHHLEGERAAGALLTLGTGIGAGMLVRKGAPSLLGPRPPPAPASVEGAAPAARESLWRRIGRWLLG